MELELHQLELRYEHLRRRCPRRERRLLGSLSEVGQQAPIVVVEGGGPYVVVDGYKRVRALRRLGQDTVSAICWEIGEAEALLLDQLMRTSPSGTALEQGWLLAELKLRFALTVSELARRFDRTPSWVSRCLGLVAALPEVVQQRVRRGEIVVHAASRYLLPLARANREECARFAAAIAGKQLSSRQVGELYVAYRTGHEQTRELLLQDPLLFLKARRAGSEPLEVDLLEQLLADLRAIAAIARRLERRLHSGALARLLPAERLEAERGYPQALRQVQRLAAYFQAESQDARSESAQHDPAAQPARP
jgi:ParB/RepB/Spo0J family partition protein